MSFDTQLPADAQHLNIDTPDMRELVSIYQFMPDLRIVEDMMFLDSFEHSEYGEVFELEDGALLSADLEENGFFYSKKELQDWGINKIMAQ